MDDACGTVVVVVVGDVTGIVVVVVVDDVDVVVVVVDVDVDVVVVVVDVDVDVVVDVDVDADVDGVGAIGMVVVVGVVVATVDVVDEVVELGDVVAVIESGTIVVVATKLLTMVGAVVLGMTSSATWRLSGDVTYVFGQERPDFQSNWRVDGFTQVGSEPLTFRSGARVLPFGQVPAFAYFKAFVRATQTTAFDLVDQIIFVSPLAQPPDLVAVKMICDLLTQNRLVVDAPPTGPSNREARSPVTKRRRNAQMMDGSTTEHCGGRTIRGSGSILEPYN